MSYVLEVKNDDLKFKSEHLRTGLLDINRLVKVNGLKEITNPVIFQKNNIPTSDGLLSNEIFGITMYDRANTCAYIDLHGWFINPVLYKVWSKLDKKIIECVHGTKKFIINSSGALEEAENGENGVEFLRKNFERINIARTASIKRDMNVDFIEHSKKDPGSFMNKLFVIPAYYRDVDTSKGGKVSIGEINELYRNVMISSRALKESYDYGLDMSAATRGRLQELLVRIFEWFGNGTTLNGVTTGANIPGKRGIIRRAITSKTTDGATRLVMTAPELKCEKVEDLQANLLYSALPLASALSNFMPFIIFNVKRRLENAFSGDKAVYKYDKKGNIEKAYHVKDYQIQFSEERIQKEIKRFLTGYSNRLIPIEVDTVEGERIALRFKGFNTTEKEYNSGVGQMAIVDRSFTWCDIFYMAAVESTVDKHIIVVRYPIDSIYNQFATRININSMNETEPMVVDGVFYPKYPKIRQEMIGKNTSNMFIDSINISNLYLEGIGGDYDGDTTTVKGIYSVEANEELEKVMHSNYNFIDFGGKGIRKASQECIQAMYNLTMVLPDDIDKMSVPKF